MLATIWCPGNSQRAPASRQLPHAWALNRAEAPLQRDALAQSQRRPTLRSGWAGASRVLAAHGGDVLILPELANSDDAKLKW